jgi:hypothetical protein
MRFLQGAVGFSIWLADSAGRRQPEVSDFALDLIRQQPVRRIPAAESDRRLLDDRRELWC